MSSQASGEVEEYAVQEGWRLTRDRKGFKMRGPGGRWERVSRDLEVVTAELYEAQRSERGGRTRGCEGLLKEKERQCLEELSKCSNAYRPLLLKSLKLILELWQLAKGYEKDSPATPKEARDALMAYVIPKARGLFIEIANALKEKEGFDEDLLAETLVRTEL